MQPEVTRDAVATLVCEAPATGAVIGQVECFGEERVRDAMTRARAAQVEWSALPLERRAELVLGLRDALVDQAEALVDTLALECGKPRQEALVHEVMLIVDLAAYYAKRAPKILAPREIDLHLFKHRKSYVHYAPLGVVGIIGPASYPLVIPADSAVTAWIAGNAVVLKPSERGSLSALKFKEVFDASGMPPDLLQIITGDASTALAMLDAAPDKVVFTGSQAVGRKVAALCGQRLIPCTLELGGRAAMVVCEDADLERAARAVVFGGFANSGQICLGVQRVFAHAAIHDALIDRVVRLTRELRQGDPREGVVDVGAMASDSQIEHAQQSVRDALDRGARLHIGGKRLPRKGRYFEPTVLSECNLDMLLMREEVSAPVVGVSRVRSDDEAVTRANTSQYGLVSYVFTRDKLRGRSIADRLRAGTVMVNDVLTGYACPEAPFGGLKLSGYGRIHGDEGLREMCETRHVNFNRVPTFRTEPVWFPYRNSTHRTMTRVMRAFMRSGSTVKKMIDLL